MTLNDNSRMLNSATKFDSSDDEFDVKSRNPKIGISKPVTVADITLTDDNNDDVERMARRKSRLLEPHPTTAVSPSANNVANRRRADAAAPRGISQAQIGEHYGNCIRLAAENKITAKNAFNLHLIDYMSDMLKKDDDAGFQVASSSLDAGAKIYAGRVDAVHQETYQVLTGLGRSEKNPADDDAENDADLEAGTDETGKATRADQRKKPQIHRDILQKQLSKIRLKLLAAKSDIDPLFQHQTSAYDEEGSSELRLNQLCTLDESCVLVLDSSTRVIQSNCQIRTDRLQIDSFVEHLNYLTAKSQNQLVMCPSLTSFRFMEWNINEDTGATNLHDSVLLPPNESDDDGFLPLNNDDVDPSVHQDSVYPVDDGAPGEEPVKLEIPTDKHPVVSNEISNVENVTNATESDLFVSSLKSMLDRQYEHFGQLNDHILGMWAGPDHWRKKAKRRRLDPLSGTKAVTDENADVETVQTVGISRRTRRAKKASTATVDYEPAKEPGENRTRNGHLTRRTWGKNELCEVPPNSNLASACVFKEPYRLKASRQINLLPTEWSDTRNCLYQLFNREIVLGSNSQIGVGNNRALNADLNRTMANMEFCTIVGVSNEKSGNLNPGEHPPSELDDIPASPLACIDDDDDDDNNDDVIPFDGIFTQATAGYDDLGAFDDMDLISQPRKIARIEIGYARTAKMINVRQLKSAIWNFLEPAILSASSEAPVPNGTDGEGSSAPSGTPTNDPVTETSAEPPNDVAPDGSSNHWSNFPTLSKLLCSLPNRISWQMTKELSVPIVFNCLLHLSNEKELYLSSSEDLANIFISQGVPDFELAPLKAYETSADTVSIDPVDSTTKKRKQRPNTRPHLANNNTLDSWLSDI